MRHIVRPPGTPPVNGYSNAVVFTGPMIAVSGQVPVDEHGEVVGAGDPEAQIRQVYANLAAVLDAAGSDLHHVIRLTIYLTDIDDLPVFRRVRDEHQDPNRPPGSSLVQVAGLVRPEFRVEVDALAVPRSPASAPT